MLPTQLAHTYNQFKVSVSNKNDILNTNNNKQRGIVQNENRA